MTNPIYLDYAATTPIAPEVVDSMLPYLSNTALFGNPSSLHSFGEKSGDAVEYARKTIAEYLHCKAKELIFTSGATESNNLAIKGIASAYRNQGKHIITSAIEHKAVLDTCKYLETQGFEVTYLRPNNKGLIVLDDILNAITGETILVSIMQVNNETGVIQPIGEIAQALKDKPLFFHVDAAQSAGKIAIDLSTTPIDLMSISAHKFYGPKGIGGLYISKRKKPHLQPIVHGGGQEHGLRPGTLPTHQIVGMATAFQLAQKNLSKDFEHCRQLKRSLLDILLQVEGVTLNGGQEHALPNIINLSFDQVGSDSLIIALRDSLAISSGSACNSGAIEASHVLRAMGIEGDRLYGAIRISLGRYTTEAEIKKAGHAIAEEIRRLRELALT
ncbi:cysteine desulfurase family protein [Methylomarinum sp. Ch1-1]|uniref:cysteine desulfurase n=1 Tax=Methylomarinum roseum TaxID=3067653 RepID=A0AAU7NQE9_9GAMM|nr:cysteine desulfurase family protein [Methylomarinum sp. Ch1-1]MDP4520839.1 cysteine desulfurase family protein [Methylomarinum sp. Ch1-1]